MTQPHHTPLSVSVGIPCHDEEKTVLGVIKGFQSELPDAEIIVIDNDSTDATAKIARDAGATVVFEKRRGKGFAVRRLFAAASGDVLVMVDGDGTYMSGEVHALLAPIQNDHVDVVVGNRLKRQWRGFTLAHRLGNRVFRGMLNFFFHTRYDDILSGYRAMRKEFYAAVPILAKGFEIETELTLQALERGYIVKEVPIKYTTRPEGSHSKIHEVRDGLRIMVTIFRLLRDYRPMWFFSYVGGAFILAGLAFGFIVLQEYSQTGFITRVPTAILTVALIIVGCYAILSGVILGTVNRRYKELEEVIHKKMQ